LRIISLRIVITDEILHLNFFMSAWSHACMAFPFAWDDWLDSIKSRPTPFSPEVGTAATATSSCRSAGLVWGALAPLELNTGSAVPARVESAVRAHSRVQQASSLTNMHALPQPAADLNATTWLGDSLSKRSQLPCCEGDIDPLSRRHSFA